MRKLELVVWPSALLAILVTIGCEREPGPGAVLGRNALTAVNSCDDFRDYLAEVTTEQLLGSGMMWDAMPGAAEDASAADGDRGGEPTDFTETNVQEEGVDEADIVETDGSYLYVLHDNDLIILDSWPADETHEVGRVEIDPDADRGWYYWGQGMFLDGDRVVTLTQSWNYETFRNGATRLTVVDVSDRAAPSVVYQADLEGYFTDARAIDGQVYLVTNSYYWSWYDDELWQLCEEMDCYSWWDSIVPERARELMRTRLLPRVRAYYEEMSLDELMPSLVEGGETRQALTCTDLHRPLRVVRGGLVLFSHVNMHADSPAVTSTGVFGGGYNLYASRQSLYLAQTSWAWHWWDGMDTDITTVVHKLSIPSGGGRPDYQASGQVPGWTLDQFSMSEHEGLLRVATSASSWWSEDETTGNGVYVLEQSGPELNVVGELNGLSPDQQIYAVRFLGDMGYMVTFQQVDPLHVIDLSNPRAPVERGELEIPGFSTYLHPVGEGLLLGIGRDGDMSLALSMFDVRDPENPTRLHQETIDIGDWSGWSEALYDHHAFTYHPERQILAIPVNIYLDGGYFTGSIVYRVTEEGGFEELGRVDHADISRAADCPEWYTDERGLCYEYDYRWWVNMRRNVFIEDNIYSISNVGLSVDDLYDPSTTHHAAVVF